MIQTDRGIVFDDSYELTYNLLNEIGISINNQGYLYDQDNATGQPINFHSFKLKASVNPAIPCYAGDGEVMFDIFNNIRLVTTMFGYCLDKEQVMNPNFHPVSHYVEDVDDTKLTALSVKMADGSVMTTEYYINKCLKFVDAMFMIYGEKVDLHNFDTMI